jgi:2,3-bisphosphoglycerate-independent phosphoglycerate mutase
MMPKKKVIFLFLDGLPDIPVDDKTPLTEADKPNIDWFAKNGATGEMLLLDKSYWTELTRTSVSHTANISLLGYDPNKFPVKRGVLEAVGADIQYKEGYLALRCNFATVDKDLRVVDRHVGRDITGLAELARYINENVDIGVPFIFKRTYEHRAALFIRMNLSDEITSNDPMKEGERVKRISATKPEALVSAKMVQDFIDKVHGLIEYHKVNEERTKKKIPAANYILVREAGNKLLDLLPHFTNKHKIKKAVAISESGSIKATCMLAGFDSITVPEIVDGGRINYRKTMDFVFNNIEYALPDYDFVFAHIKETDVAAHDKDFDRRKEVIEAIDKHLEAFKDSGNILVITSDHITSTETGKHEYGVVPVLVYGKGKDKSKKFDEVSVKKGKLKKYTGAKLMKFVFGN